MSSSDSSFSSTFFSSLAGSAAAPPAAAPPTGAAATATAPPPAGTEASFSLPAAMSSVMSFPLTCDNSNSSLSSSGSIPTEDKMFFKSSAEGLALPPKTANKYAATIFISAGFGSETK
uniref:Uncharacterized protein n=1 Tax=Opuntia streptacantha TaxID=393608 RepID=A0A7C9DLY3_OPUST